MLKVFLHLRIKEVELQKDSEDIAPKKKFMTYKEKRKNLSRMQRKVWPVLSHALLQWIYLAICSSNDCTCPVAIVNSQHQWLVFALNIYEVLRELVVSDRKEYI